MKIQKNNKYYIKALKRESEFWEGTNTLYEDHPNAVIEYEQLNRFGDKNITMYDFFLKIGPFENVLSIGSGDGSFEFMLLQKDIIKNVCFVDISSKAIEKIKNEAERLGLTNRISIQIADLNFIELISETYDLVCCLNVLHHVINLEECIFELNKSLKNNGKILIDDFIGEKKMYRSDTKIAITKSFQTHIKEKYNIETKQFIRTNPKVLTNNCPFECIRSDELDTIIQYYFGNMKVREIKYGYIFNNWALICKDPTNIFFNQLKIFDDFAAKYNLVVPNRIFGIYKKSDKKIIQSLPWTLKEIKNNIKINIINEKSILKLGFKIANRFPLLGTILKKIYFILRK